MKFDQQIKQLEDRLEFAGWIGGNGDDGGDCNDTGCGGSSGIVIED